MALMWCAGGATAGPFAPGPEPDPPTGATGQPEAAQTLPAGSGIQWRLAPLRYGGSVSLDVRWLRIENGSRSTQGLMFNDIDFATYVWQPWFIQLGAGLGALAARDTTRGTDTPTNDSTSAALTGRFSMAVFPSSRFPFQLRAEVNDSRVKGDTLGTDYRSQRFSLSQSYRPEAGNDSYSVDYERSQLSARQGGEDTVSILRGTVVRQFGEQSIEVSGYVTDNTRSDSDDRSRVATLSGRHTYSPASALHVDTLATWNEVRLRSGSGVERQDGTTDIRQLSSFATWRPREGEWLYSEASPLYLTGSMRVIDAGTDNDNAKQRLRALNASVGGSQEITREWRLAGAVSGSQTEPEGGDPTKSATGNATLTYTPQGLQIDEWRYTPSLGFNLGASRSSGSGNRLALGGQAGHGVSRSFALDETDNFSVNLTQSLGALRDSQSSGWTRALAHSAGAFWQGVGDAASQSFASLSVSDSRTWAQDDGSFQLVNLQYSRRSQLSRHASWSGNLTLQATHSDTSQLDPFSGARHTADAGWQRFYSGSLSFEHQRLWGVPRLRYTALLSVNSQQLESRAAGDVDAPRERITESLENRIDYSIGRLEARMSARLVRLDNRSVASVFARVQRRY